MNSIARIGDNRYIHTYSLELFRLFNAKLCFFSFCLARIELIDFGIIGMWQVFIMADPINVGEGDHLNLGLVMSRSKENHRLMEVELECEIKEASGNPKESFEKTYFIE